MGPGAVATACVTFRAPLPFGSLSWKQSLAEAVFWLLVLLPDHAGSSAVMPLAVIHFFFPRWGGVRTNIVLQTQGVWMAASILTAFKLVPCSASSLEPCYHPEHVHRPRIASCLCPLGLGQPAFRGRGKTKRAFSPFPLFSSARSRGCRMQLGSRAGVCGAAWGSWWKTARRWWKNPWQWMRSVGRSLLSDLQVLELGIK